jgi:hypothetical protein
MIKMIKSKYAPVFAIFTLVLSFFQLYSKMYFYHNAYQTGIFILDVFIAIVAAFGLSTVTIIILVHSKNRNTPVFFAVLDFCAGFLFFGKNLYPSFLAGDMFAIGTALFLPTLKACALYFLAEIFLSEQEGNVAENKELAELNKEKESLISIKQRLENELAEMKKGMQEQSNELAKKENETQTDMKGLSKSLNEMQTRNNELDKTLNDTQTKMKEMQLMNNQLQYDLIRLDSFKKTVEKAFPPDVIKNTINRTVDEDRKNSLKQVLANIA